MALSLIGIRSKEGDGKKIKQTVICSDEYVDNDYIKKDSVICKKDIENIYNFVEKIKKHENITEFEFNNTTQSIDILLKKLKVKDYKNFIQSIKTILLDPEYYIKSGPYSLTEARDYIPKKFFIEFITHISGPLNYLLENNINNIKEEISSYNTITDKFIKDLENNKKEWDKKRKELDDLCEEFKKFKNYNDKIEEKEQRCSKNIDIEAINKNIESLKLELTKKEQSKSKQEIDEISIQLPPPPPPPISNLEQTQSSQSSQPVSPDKILKQYIETFKTIYFNPFFYQIVSLDINDFVSLFDPTNSKNRITINYYEKNTVKTYEHEELFNVLFNFIYVDVTPFYNLIQNKEEKNPQLGFLIESIEKLTDKILFDTEKANDIIKTKNNEIKNIEIKNKKYLFIKNFYEIIEKTITLNYLDINYIFVYFINLVREQIEKTIKLYKILNSTENEEIKISNKNAYKKLENILSKKSSDMVLTFLKINNFENKSEKTNKRFNIDNVSMDENKLVLKYNDDNIIYYDTKNRNNITINNNAESILSTYYNITKYNTYFTFDKKNYKNKYNLGPFTKIFNFDKTNEIIANELEIVQKLLEKQIPVFILGYGASGAGKTSSLIYNRNDGQNGIIVYLCNLMAKKNIYDTIELKSSEFYAERLDLNSNSNENTKTIIRHIPENNNPILFEYRDADFKLKGSYTHKNIHIKNNKEFGENTKIGEILEYIIDTDRLVFATTNNPNSSRSHVLSFLKFKKGNEKEVTLIVGDFAGVENIFNCDDKETIEKFNEIKKFNEITRKYENYYEFSLDEEAKKLSEEGTDLIISPIEKYIMGQKEENIIKINLYNKFSNKGITQIDDYNKVKNLESTSTMRSIDNKINNFKSSKNLQDFINNINTIQNLQPPNAKYHVEAILPTYKNLHEKEKNEEIEKDFENKKKINEEKKKRNTRQLY